MNSSSKKTANNDSPRLLVVGNLRAKQVQAALRLCGQGGIPTRQLWLKTRHKWRPLTEEKYQAQFGDDVDFAAAAIYRIASDGRYARRQFLNRRSLYYYGARRAFAAEMDEIIRDFRPDAVAVFHMLTDLAAIATAKARAHKIGVLHCEMPMIPSANFYADCIAPVFVPGQSMIDDDWKLIKDRAIDSADVRRRINEWRTSKKSRYTIADDAEEKMRLDSFLADGRPVALIPLQQHGIHCYLPEEFDGDYSRWLSVVIAHFPKEWKAIVKAHPKTDYRPTLSGDNLFLAEKANLHNLLEKCSCVITLASNVGFESLMIEKPVIVGGRTHYAGKGLTLDLHRAEDLPNLLAQSLHWKFSQDARERFLNYVLADYHVYENEADKFRERIFRAKLQRASDFDSRAPFFEFWPNSFMRYKALMDEYTEKRFRLGSRHSRLLRGFRRHSAKTPAGEFNDSPLDIFRDWLRRRIRAMQRSFAKRIGQ